MDWPGAAVRRGYTTNGVLPVIKLSCQRLTSSVVIAPPMWAVVLGAMAHSTETRGPQPFLSSLYPGWGLMVSVDPGNPVPPSSTGAEVRLFSSRMGEVISYLRP